MRTCSVFSSPGVRPQNEDTIFAEGEIFILADGLGGHADGKIASELAVQTISRLFSQENPAEFVIGGRRMEEAELMQAFLMDVIRQAGAVVLQEARKRGSNMATTVTAVILNGEKGYCAHVGDCALLVSEDGSLPPVHLTVEHRRGASLNRTLGSNEQVTPDLMAFSASPTGFFLLGCDGFWEHVGDQEISRLVMETPDYLLAERLGQTALKNGSSDNVSIVAVVGEHFSNAYAQSQVELERARINALPESAEKTSQMEALRGFANRHGIPFTNPLEEENQLLRAEIQTLESENRALKEEILGQHNIIEDLKKSIDLKSEEYQQLANQVKNSPTHYWRLRDVTLQLFAVIQRFNKLYPNEMISALSKPELERLGKIYQSLAAQKPPEK